MSPSDFRGRHVTLTMSPNMPVDLGVGLHQPSGHFACLRLTLWACWNRFVYCCRRAALVAIDVGALGDRRPVSGTAGAISPEPACAVVGRLAEGVEVEAGCRGSGEAHRLDQRVRSSTWLVMLDKGLIAASTMWTPCSAAFEQRRLIVGLLESCVCGWIGMPISCTAKRVHQLFGCVRLATEARHVLDAEKIRARGFSGASARST